MRCWNQCARALARCRRALLRREGVILSDQEDAEEQTQDPTHAHLAGQDVEHLVVGLDEKKPPATQPKKNSVAWWKRSFAVGEAPSKWARGTPAQFR